MAMYTFYLCSGDGASTTFEAFELGGDEHAPERALKLLTEHPTCAYVAVWEGDRPLLERHRTKPIGADWTDRRRRMPAEEQTPGDQS